MSIVTDILKKLDTLNSGELQQISEKLLKLLQDVNDVDGAPAAHVDQCRKCSSKHIVKFGKDKNGKQRYRCKSCGATFTATSYSTLSNTHCSIDVWEKYIALLLKGCTLKECAVQCHISVRTAFIWRHKVLNALRKDQSVRVMAGIVEIDEMYVSISYKGNHKKSKRFTMPREAYKRGGESKTKAGSRACVMCAVERNGQTYGEVLGKGTPSFAKLAYAFEDRIMPESIVISDKASSTKAYFKTRKTVELIQLAAHANRYQPNSPPEIRGAYHIQNVNNLHNRFRRFLRPYNGVSTKYLNHYVSLFIWLENYRLTKKQSIVEDTSKYVSKTDMYVSGNDIFAMLPIPNPGAA